MKTSPSRSAPAVPSTNPHTGGIGIALHRQGRTPSPRLVSSASWCVVVYVLSSKASDQAADAALVRWATCRTIVAYLVYGAYGLARPPPASAHAPRSDPH